MRSTTPADLKDHCKRCFLRLSSCLCADIPEVKTRTPSTASLPPLGEEEYERLGIKLLERGSYEKATQAFRAARESRPGSPYASYLLAQALFAAGEYGPAAQAIRDGAAQNPDWARARVDVRSFYSDTRDLKTHCRLA